jgi:hypothetical protein
MDTLNFVKIFDKYKSMETPDAYLNFYLESFPLMFEIYGDWGMVKYINKLIYMFLHPSTVTKFQEFINENKIDVIIDIGSGVGYHSAVFESKMFQHKLTKPLKVYSVDIMRDSYLFTMHPPTHICPITNDQTFDKKMEKFVKRTVEEFAEKMFETLYDKSKTYCLFYSYPRINDDSDYIYLNKMIQICKSNMFVIFGPFGEQNSGSRTFKGFLEAKFLIKLRSINIDRYYYYNLNRDDGPLVNTMINRINKPNDPKQHQECKNQLKQFVIDLQNPFEPSKEVYPHGEEFAFYERDLSRSTATVRNASTSANENANESASASANAGENSNKSGESSRKRISNKNKNKKKAKKSKKKAKSIK